MIAEQVIASALLPSGSGSGSVFVSASSVSFEPGFFVSGSRSVFGSVSFSDSSSASGSSASVVSSSCASSSGGVLAVAAAVISSFKKFQCH